MLPAEPESESFDVVSRSAQFLLLSIIVVVYRFSFIRFSSEHIFSASSVLLAHPISFLPSVGSPGG
jgi:hypothetical protein